MATHAQASGAVQTSSANPQYRYRYADGTTQLEALLLVSAALARSYHPPESGLEPPGPARYASGRVRSERMS